jgi:hypothetical protein
LTRVITGEYNSQLLLIAVLLSAPNVVVVIVAAAAVDAGTHFRRAED